MPSIPQAVSAVGSVTLVLAVGLGWWYSDIRTKTSAAQKEYLEHSREATRAEIKARDAIATVQDLEDELERLRDQRKKQKSQLTEQDGDKLVRLKRSVDALRARANTPWSILAFLSYGLTPVSDDRSEDEKKALGQDLRPSRVVITDVTIKADTAFVSGECLLEKDIDHLRARLGALGHLTAIKRKEVVRKNDLTVKKPYWVFTLTAELVYLEVVDLDDDEDSP